MLIVCSFVMGEVGGLDYKRIRSNKNLKMQEKAEVVLPLEESKEGANVPHGRGGGALTALSPDSLLLIGGASR